MSEPDAREGDPFGGQIETGEQTDAVEPGESKTRPGADAPGSPISEFGSRFKSTLSYLDYRTACGLLGPEGKDLIRAGGRLEIGRASCRERV